LRITIAIATWNRAFLLGGTLDAVLEAELPGDHEVELMVVDNGSTDETPQVLGDYADAHGVVALREEVPGKSNALNHAMSQATGDVIIWIDDDIRVEGDWLLRYAEAFEAFPEAAIFGGSIVPEFEGSPPAWIVHGMSEIGGLYGQCLPVEGPITLSDPFLPFGGNMAIRRTTQLRYPFDPRLGRRHGQMLAGEESAVVRAILEDGGSGRWVPTACVRHVIPERLQSLEHVRRYFHDFGVSLSSPEGEGTRLLPPRWAIRDAIEQEARFRIGRRLGWPPPVWLRSLRLASFAQGTIRGTPMPR
jgi:glucosyl-dolichyl phosphate glucuronosyltransferase